MMRTGSAVRNNPTPRYACVSSADGLTKAASTPPFATSSAKIAEPVASRSHGRNSSPEPLPTVMTMSRLPPYGVAGLPAICRPISHRVLARTKLAPFGNGSMAGISRCAKWHRPQCREARGERSAGEVVGDLRRPVALDHGVGRAIVLMLQHRALAELLAAYDDRHRAGRTALLRMYRARRHQIDLALRAGRHRSELHLGMSRPAAVVDPLKALQALGAVEHAVEHPGIGVIVHAAGTPRHAHHAVDDESVVRIDIEQEVLAAFGGRPAYRMGFERFVQHQPLHERLRLLHAALIIRFRCPDCTEVADEFFENRQTLRGKIRHGRFLHSNSGSPSTVQRRSSRRSSFGKSVRAWMVQRLSHIRKSPSCQTCSKMKSRRSPIS